MKFISRSEKETIAFGKKFAKKLKGGEVLGLIGELGAGKTQFVKGLAQGLGIKTRVTSPTFVLMRVYPVKGHKTIKTFVHVDAYRLKNTDSIDSIGLEEYLKRTDCVCAIEWADRISKSLPRKMQKLLFSNNKKDRIISFS